MSIEKLPEFSRDDAPVNQEHRETVEEEQTNVDVRMEAADDDGIFLTVSNAEHPELHAKIFIPCEVQHVRGSGTHYIFAPDVLQALKDAFPGFDSEDLQTEWRDGRTSTLQMTMGDFIAQGIRFDKFILEGGTVMNAEKVNGKRLRLPAVLRRFQ